MTCLLAELPELRRGAVQRGLRARRGLRGPAGGLRGRGGPLVVGQVEDVLGAVVPPVPLEGLLGGPVVPGAAGAPGRGLPRGLRLPAPGAPRRLLEYIISYIYHMLLLYHIILYYIVLYYIMLHYIMLRGLRGRTLLLALALAPPPLRLRLRAAVGALGLIIRSL